MQDEQLFFGYVVVSKRSFSCELITPGRKIQFMAVMQAESIFLCGMFAKRKSDGIL